MYVAPRPRLEDDPLFPVRIGAMAVACLCAVQVFRPALSTLMVTIPVFLVTAQRGAFNPMLIAFGLIFFGVMAIIYTPIFNYTHDMPAVHLIVTFAAFFAGIHFARQTGSALGMMTVMPALMLSIIAVKNGQLLYLTRDGILQTVVLQLVAIPILYLLIPTKTTVMIFPGSIIPDDSDVAGSLIRAGVLLTLTLTIFARLPISDIALSIAAVFAMMFPDHDMMFRRVTEWIIATFFGAAAAAAIALIVGWNGHFIVLIGLVFLACCYIGRKMFDGWYHSAMYQYVIVSLLIVLQTALTTSDWNRAAVLRVTLTLAGGGGGAKVVAALETKLRQSRAKRRMRSAA
jgi:hypothetical protein